MEADVYPKNKPELADLVDGSIGEGSFFHQNFGNYAQGVGPETAILPKGWQHRLVSVRNANTNGIEGLCLEVHDLAISKCVAGRQKDLAFTRELTRRGLTNEVTLKARLTASKLNVALAKLVAGRIARDFMQQAGRRGR